MKKGALVDGLNEAIKAERSLADYYHNAREHTHDPAIKRVFTTLQERHYAHSEAIEVERERVQSLEGEGMFGDLFESIGRAIADTIAGLPVMGIEETSHATFETLRRFERKLCELYQEVLSLADEAGKGFLERSIEQCRGYIAKLDELDPLSRAHQE
jgi:rubrerythrin